MRSHKAIIEKHGASVLARELVERGVKLTAGAVQRWKERDSIPGEYWTLIEEAGAASVAELADAAGARVLAEARAA